MTENTYLYHGEWKEWVVGDSGSYEEEREGHFLASGKEEAKECLLSNRPVVRLYKMELTSKHFMDCTNED